MKEPFLVTHFVCHILMKIPKKAHVEKSFDFDVENKFHVMRFKIFKKKRRIFYKISSHFKHLLEI